MPNKDESVIRSAIKDYIENEGGVAFVVPGSIKSAGGTPDIIASLWGARVNGWMHYVLEVKTETGEPDKRQIEVLRKWGARGFFPMIVRSIQQLHFYHRDWDLMNANYPFVSALRQFKTMHEDTYDIWNLE